MGPMTTRPAIEPGAIDAHAHVYPSDYLDMLERIGVPANSTKIARGMGADITSADMAERLRWMDRAGVAAQVLAVTPQSPSGPDAEGSLAAARWINECYARLVTEHSGRFLAYGALPLPHVAQSLDEVSRIFDDYGMQGVSVPATLPAQMSLADDRLNDVWAALDERGSIVNIHATGSGACSPLITDHALGWVNGAPVEDATAVLQLLKADVPARYPNLRFHVAHLGGDLPFLFQRLEDNYEDWGTFEHSPQQALRRMWFDAANFHEPSLRLAVETFGASQIMAGSDMPYFKEGKYVRAVDYIRTSSLDGDVIADVLENNARRLYALPLDA